jgi:hypothetical protein
MVVKKNISFHENNYFSSLKKIAKVYLLPKKECAEQTFLTNL